LKTLLQIIAICLAGGAFSQTLLLPARDANAPDGSDFAGQISGLDFAQREQEIANAVLAGNIPSFLRKFCPVAVTNVCDAQTNTGIFFAAPDYLAVGSDADYFFAPVSPNTAQRIADRLGCVLPTPKMVDAIYAAAEVKLAPTPIPPSPAMTTASVFEQYNEIVRRQRAAFSKLHPLGALVAGDKKDVVICARLAGLTNRVAIYGWHQPNGVPIQPLYTGHSAAWVDYSQGVRLIRQKMIVNGKIKSVADVLADPKLCGLISSEGVVTDARYPTNPVCPIAGVKIDLPWPKDFAPSPYFGERIRKIELPEENARILINAPPPKSFSPDKPVLLIFYALPNGNTIEQTIGKKLQPGDDWHFDIQHIGAQTRFLRNCLTNCTLVVVYLQATSKSWPAWRRQHSDESIAGMLNDVRGIFSASKEEVVLASHSGGGGLIFGYLNTVEKIPSDVKRIAFLDSDYDYDNQKYADKIRDWLAASAENHLCVLAYQDYLARLNGKPFISEGSGTWGHSRAMLRDLESRFQFTSQTNDGLETYSALDGRIEFLLKENPEGKILHTVQVGQNGFIQAMLSGTANENQGYQYLGQRAYTNWIQEN
jgi:hypothetical protein